MPPFLWKTSKGHDMQYKTKSLRRRRNTNKWECVLEHTNPITNAIETTYHTVEGKTRNQAEQARNDLIIKMELEGFCASSDMTVYQFMQTFLEYKASSKTIESSTIRGYRGEIKMMCKYIGETRLCDLTIPVVNEWMATMSQDGYAPKSAGKRFRLLKQALNYAIAQDLLTKTLVTSVSLPNA